MPDEYTSSPPDAIPISGQTPTSSQPDAIPQSSANDPLGGYTLAADFFNGGKLYAKHKTLGTVYSHNITDSTAINGSGQVDLTASALNPDVDANPNDYTYRAENADGVDFVCFHVSDLGASVYRFGAFGLMPGPRTITGATQTSSQPDGITVANSVPTSSQPDGITVANSVPTASQPDGIAIAGATPTGSQPDAIGIAGSTPTGSAPSAITIAGETLTSNEPSKLAVSGSGDPDLISFELDDGSRQTVSLTSGGLITVTGGNLATVAESTVDADFTPDAGTFA